MKFTTPLIKILRYEIMNIARNRWAVFYSVILALLSFGLVKISGDFSKAVLSLSEILAALVPLTAILFSVIYWYHSERFTIILLTQPLARPQILFARIVALAIMWLYMLTAGIIIPFVLMSAAGTGVLLIFFSNLFLAIVFGSVGLWIANLFEDRIKGIGGALIFWFYLLILHDALILFVLLGFKEYPLDVAASTLTSLNPIGLTRVAQLLHYDAALLLSYGGALTRNLLSGALGTLWAFIVSFLWLSIPIWASVRNFKKRDF